MVTRLPGRSALLIYFAWSFLASDALRAANPPPLTPEETVKTFTLAPGFRATVFAGESDVHQPIGMVIDDRGRIWVAESDSYPDWKEEGTDRIVVFEDVDGDGHFDKRTVFYDKLNYVTGLEVGFGGVFVISAPSLLFIPDKNHDDVPDGPPEVLLDGFGHQGVHNLVNGGVWGPDGWLYAGHGGSSWGYIGKPGAPDSQRTFYDGGIWRYHPVKKIFESFMEGTTNPWGQDFDEYGEMFISNSVTPHFYHVIQGSHVERRRFSPLSKYAYGVIPEAADHKHYVGGEWNKSGGGKPEQIAVGGGHAHSGCMIYYGGTFPDQYRGVAFMNNIHGDRVNNDLLARKGSGYTASHGTDFLTVGDPWFQGLQLRYGPDGNVYLSDWYDTSECHTRKPSRTNGRIYKITYNDASREKKSSRDPGLTAMTDAQLVDLQMSPNEWYARHARRLLQERGTGPEARTKLISLLESGQTTPLRLRALFALDAVNGVTHELTLTLLRDPDEHVRSWAIRFACEDHHPAADVLERMQEMARDDASAAVCLELTSAAQRIDGEPRWAILEQLAHREAFASDQNIPLMVWYGLEPLVMKDRARALKLAATAKLPHLREYVARRIASGG